MSTSRARKTVSKGGKPDKLIRDALILELKREGLDDNGKKALKLRLLARAFVDRAILNDTPAAKEIFDRVDGKVLNLSAMDDNGLRLEDLIHMSYQAGRQSKVEKRPEPKLLPVIDIKAEKVE